MVSGPLSRPFGDPVGDVATSTSPLSRLMIALVFGGILVAAAVVQGRSQAPKSTASVALPASVSAPAPAVSAPSAVPGRSYWVGTWEIKPGDTWEFNRDGSGLRISQWGQGTFIWSVKGNEYIIDRTSTSDVTMFKEPMMGTWEAVDGPDGSPRIACTSTNPRNLMWEGTVTLMHPRR